MKLQFITCFFQNFEKRGSFSFLKKTRLPAQASGFSLIEVVLAVGVAAFALVTIMGLLPAGLSTFKNSMNTAVGSQIAQRVFNDLQVADFTYIQNTNRYFDEQGNDLNNNSNAVKCIYWVQVSILSNPVVTGTTSTNLKIVQVMIANNPGGALPTNVIFSGTNKNTMVFSSLLGRSK